MSDQQSPNIIFVMTDQQRAATIGAWGCPHMITPNLDRLAGELLSQLLAWLATSTYWNAGYRRERSRAYEVRWPTPEDPYLHGARSRGGPRPVEVL